MRNEVKQAIILTGPPGSGKSTVLELMQDGRNAATIETGKLLRRHIEDETDLGREVEPYLEKGSWRQRSW